MFLGASLLTLPTNHYRLHFFYALLIRTQKTHYAFLSSTLASFEGVFSA